MVLVAVLLPPLLLCMMLALGRYEEWMLRPPRSTRPSGDAGASRASRLSRALRFSRASRSSPASGTRHLSLIRGGARAGTPPSPSPSLPPSPPGMGASGDGGDAGYLDETDADAGPEDGERPADAA